MIRLLLGTTNLGCLYDSDVECYPTSSMYVLTYFNFNDINPHLHLVVSVGRWEGGHWSTAIKMQQSPVADPLNGQAYTPHHWGVHIPQYNTTISIGNLNSIDVWHCPHYKGPHHVRVVVCVCVCLWMCVCVCMEACTCILLQHSKFSSERCVYHCPLVHVCLCGIKFQVLLAMTWSLLLLSWLTLTLRHSNVTSLFPRCKVNNKGQQRWMAGGGGGGDRDGKGGGGDRDGKGGGGDREEKGGDRDGKGGGGDRDGKGGVGIGMGGVGWG